MTRFGTTVFLCGLVGCAGIASGAPEDTDAGYAIPSDGAIVDASSDRFLSPEAEVDRDGSEPRPVFVAEWCEDADTVLGSVASTLGRRTWAQMPANASLDGLDLHRALLYWADSAVWDRRARQIHFVGGPGSCCADPPAYERITYDVADDTWTIDATPFAASGHSYDANALDPETSDLFFGLLGNDTVYRFDGNGWSELPGLPYRAPTTPAMAWLDELRLVHVGGSGNLATWDGSEWNVIPAPEPTWGTYNTFVEPSEVHNVVWLGAGNGATRVHYRLDADRTLTRLADAPISLNNSAALHSYEPVSGNFLVREEDNDAYWEFDIMADEWSRIEDMQNTPELTSGSRFQVPIPDCGVVLYFDHYRERRNVYIYRH